MAKSTSKNKKKPAPVVPPVTNPEEINSYDEQVNKRIDPKRPEGGTPEPESQPVGEALAALGAVLSNIPTNDRTTTESTDSQDNGDTTKEDVEPVEKTEASGKTIVEEILEALKTPPPPETLSEDVLGILAAYVEAYPDNNVFHVTSDGQVFLDKGKSDAINHEKGLGGKLKSYQV